MELSGADRDLYNALRDKYANGAARDDVPGLVDGLSAAPQPDVQAMVQAAPPVVSKSSDTDVRMCHACQGSGAVHELYNHRRLEVRVRLRMCDTCAGRGVRVFKQGVEVTDPEEGHRESDDTHATPDNGSPPPSMTDEEAQQLHDDLRKIAAHMQRCQEEERALQRQREGCQQQDGAEERRLVDELLAQLKARLSRLRRVRGKKEAELVLAGRSLAAMP